MKVYTVWYLDEWRNGRLWCVCGSEQKAKEVQKFIVENDYSMTSWWNEEEVQE